MGLLRRFRQSVHPPTWQERQKIIADIAESASPGFDFCLPVLLPCSLNTAGLITKILTLIAELDFGRPMATALPALLRVVRK